MSADVGGLRVLARELGEHEQFQVHAHALNNAANEIWVMQKKLEQYQQMAEKTIHAIALELDENDKLRELVRHMYTCMGNVDADGNHECIVCKYEGAECYFDRRMCELGVEVD